MNLKDIAGSYRSRWNQPRGVGPGGMARRNMSYQLNAVRAAAKALGGSAEREVVNVKKRVLSAAGWAAIVKAAKKRWEKVRK